MSEVRRSLDRYSDTNSNHVDMDTKTEFMREVRDNFLLCKLCNKDFDRPKTLPCMHSFCVGCLLTYADDTRQTYRYTTYTKPLNCPVCRKRTDVTKNDIESLPDNFLISSLSGIIRDRARDTSACDICSRRGKGRKPNAVQKCLECDKQLCRRCVVLHQDTKVTAHHSLFSLENADRLMCVEHEEEAVRFICKTCSKCVCVFCTYTTHKGHDLVSILEGTENYQHEMEKTMENCSKRMDNINSKLQFIRTWEDCYNQTRDHILTTATNFLTQVESQRQSFLNHLDKLYGPEMLEILSKKEELIENLEGLSSACKYKDVIADTNCLEAVLIQSELQNKVRRLLDTPISIPDELPDNENMSISFEKGGIRLGTLIKQNGDEEPIYFDGDDEDDSSSWCRQCRARSRSFSLDKEVPGLSLQKRLLGNLSHSLTPFRSDTDLSLTDVSALDNMSPQLIRMDSQMTDSTASDLDKVCETAEFGVQVQMGLVDSITVSSIECADSATQYEQSVDETSKPSPTLVDSCSQYDTIYKDSYSQYELNGVSTASQSEKVSLQTSSTQSDVMTEDASSQYESSTTSSSTQHEVELTNSCCQHDTVVVDNSAQYELSTAESSTQSPLKLYSNASSQHEVTYADFSAMHRPLALDRGCGTPLKSSCDSFTMTPIHSYSETGVDVQTDLKCPGVDNSTCTEQLQHTDTGVGDSSVSAGETGTMTELLIPQKSQSTSTIPLDVKDVFVNTEAKVTVDCGSSAYYSSGYSRATQTSTLIRIDSSTNTPERVKVTSTEVNTVPIPQAHQCVQTNNSKLKSRGINVKPDVKDSGIDIKPSVAHVSTKTDGPNTTQHETQTAIKTYSHMTSNTTPVHNKSRGITVHISGVNKATNTRGVSGSSNSSTQTGSRNLIDSSCGEDDVFATIEDVKTSVDAFCGPDIPIFNSKTSSTNTRAVETASVSVGTSSKTRDGWCYPRLPDVASRACETEKPRLRNVGLYVRPVSKDMSVMTPGIPTQDKSCGAEYRLTFRTVGTHCTAKQSTVHIDTSDLKYSRHQSTSMEGLNIMKPLKVHSTQTDTVNTTENYTVMTEAFSTDRATNTPSHLPADVYSNFTYSPPVEMLHRATQTDLIYSQAPTTAPTAASNASAVQSGSTVCMVSASPSGSSRLPRVVAQGIDAFKSVPVSTTPDCKNLASNKKVLTASKSTLANPTTRDQSTSTATLSALLHTERLSIDSMDSKISECITKLRQVTKKLQTSSTDVTKSQMSINSANLNDMDFDRSGIAAGDDMSLSSPIPTSPHSRTQSCVESEPPDVSVLPSKPATPAHRRTRSASNVPETSPRESRQRITLNKVRHADCPALDYAYPSDPPPFQNVVLLKPEQHEAPTPTQALVKSQLSAVEQMVKTYSRNKTTILPAEPGICYTAKPAQNIRTPTAASSQTSARESTPSGDQKAKDGGRLARIGRQVRGKSEDQNYVKPASSRPKRWDLKSLVHEEDRLNKQMRVSRESLNDRRLYMERRGSAAGNETVRSGLLSGTPTTSQYGSTDSLNQLLAGRGPRKAPKVAVKSQKSSRIKTGRKLSPAPSLTSIPTNQRPSVLKSKSSVRSSIRADGSSSNRKAKARAKTLQPSNLLGYNRSRSGSSSSEKSMKSSTNSDTSRHSAGSARYIVSSVVRKVQSIGRQKPSSGSATAVLGQVDEQVTKSDCLPPTQYPSEALAERLAHHTLPLPNQNPSHGPPLSPKLSRRSKSAPNKTASNKPPWH